MNLVPDEPTPITLTRAEALVLFEWLHGLQDSDVAPGDTSARVALWNLSGILERALVEPFAPNYQDLVNAAKAHLLRP